MKISAQTMQGFSDRAYKDFEDRMVRHLVEFFPDQCKELGEVSVRALIRKGEKTASGYLLDAEQDVCLYVDLMFLLGEDFDTDPEIPWANAILTEQPEDPEEKMDRLYSTAGEHLQEAQRRGQNS
jgi:hypothetical protein